MTHPSLPVYADIEAATAALAPVAVRTHLLSSPALDAQTGARVFIKPEVLQRTGSFKFRGAYNRLSLIPQSERLKGVVAFSSGNHAQGVAAAAQLLGLPATIVMPADAPVFKRERTKSYGASVVLYARRSRKRLLRKVARRWCRHSMIRASSRVRAPWASRSRKICMRWALRRTWCPRRRPAAG
jgi:threonine dehydratase